jgi:branched-chain amino acid transport system substrate-binding protein
MQKSWSRIFALAMGIPLLLAILAACGPGTTTNTGNTPTGSKVIEIGSDLPVSGKDTANGLPAQNGAAFAVDEANASNYLGNGYSLKFVPKDDVGPNGTHDAPTGVKNVKDLIADSLVSAIVGPFNSAVAKAEMPVTNAAPIAQISPSNTNTCLTKSGADIGCSGANDIAASMRPSGKVTYFRIATTDDHQSAVIADYLYKTLNYKKAFIIDDTEVYGVGIANGFIKEWQSLGGTIIDHKSEPPTTTSFVGLLTQVASSKPDFIFYGGTDSDGGTLVRQQMLQVQGLQKTPFAGGDGIQTTAFASTIGLTGGPSYSTVAAVNPDTLPSAATFITQYKAKYGANQYGAYSAGGYDCAKIIIQAIKAVLAKGVQTPANSSDSAQAKVFRQAVIDAIQGISYDGVTGHHTFDANGDTTDKVISIYQVGDVGGGKADWKFLTQLAIQ